MKVVDCRVCGDPNSVLRFAFIEFMDEGKLMNLLLEMNELIVEFGLRFIVFYLSCRRCKECFGYGRNCAWFLSGQGVAFKNCNCTCESNIFTTCKYCGSLY